MRNDRSDQGGHFPLDADQLAQLEPSLTDRRHALLHERAGLPEPAVARELLAELRRALWSWAAARRGAL